MKYIPLSIKANENGWRFFLKRNKDPKFQVFKKSILDRDQHTCQFCGFQSKQLQEIVNIDGNYRNMKSTNLATACPLCVPCHFINVTGFGSFSYGTIIYLPEISQNKLNAISHVLLCAIHNNTPAMQKSTEIFDCLKARGELVETKINKGFSNPARLGQSIIDCHVNDKRALSEKLLTNLRMLPSLESYASHLTTYSISALEDSYKVIKQIGGG